MCSIMINIEIHSLVVYGRKYGKNYSKNLLSITGSKQKLTLDQTS